LTSSFIVVRPFPALVTKRPPMLTEPGGEVAKPLLTW
jgi:hypothetical protein